MVKSLVIALASCLTFSAQAADWDFLPETAHVRAGAWRVAPLPAGKDPDSVTTGVGEPVAVMVKLLLPESTNVAALPLVMAGAAGVSMSSDTLRTAEVPPPSATPPG